jgi:DHA1 family bicyclomycin/chloramphenicol resistance-like MFS transporter
MAGALAPFPERAGAASSLLGCIQMGLAALVGGAVGYFDNGTQTPMGVIIGITGLAALSAYWFIARPAFQASDPSV